MVALERTPPGLRERATHLVDELSVLASELRWGSGRSPSATFWIPFGGSPLSLFSLYTGDEGVTDFAVDFDFFRQEVPPELVEGMLRRVEAWPGGATAFARLRERRFKFRPGIKCAELLASDDGLEAVNLDRAMGCGSPSGLRTLHCEVVRLKCGAQIWVVGVYLGSRLEDVRLVRLEDGPVGQVVAEPRAIPDAGKGRGVSGARLQEHVTTDLLGEPARRAGPYVASVKIVDAVVQEPRGEMPAQVRERIGVPDVAEGPDELGDTHQTAGEPAGRNDACRKRDGRALIISGADLCRDDARIGPVPRKALAERRLALGTRVEHAVLRFWVVVPVPERAVCVHVAPVGPLPCVGRAPEPIDDFRQVHGAEGRAQPPTRKARAAASTCGPVSSSVPSRSSRAGERSSS
jgi:hypothetical protein